MRRFIAITILSLVGLVGNIYALPANDVTIMNEEVVNIDENVIQMLNDDEEEKIGIITTVLDFEAKLRDIPSVDGNTIRFIEQGTEVYVKEQIDNWYAVNIEDREGYIYKEQLDQSNLADIKYTNTQQIVLEEVTIEEVIEEVYLGEEIVEKAKQYIGNPYVYGGTSLTKGADCSGFVQQIFKQFDIQLERTSRSQYASNGYKVTKSELLPGDLVFYGYGGYISHVAIYAGNNQVVHADTARTGICMGALQQNKPIIGIKRIIE